MIVEEQGIDFRTGVRFPSAPLWIMLVFPYFIRDSGIFFLEMLDYLLAVLLTFLGCFHWNSSPIYLLCFGIIILITVEIVLSCTVNIIMSHLINYTAFVNISINKHCAVSFPYLMRRTRNNMKRITRTDNAIVTYINTLLFKLLSN